MQSNGAQQHEVLLAASAAPLSWGRCLMDEATYGLIFDHLVSHLTDGWWHDECRYCLARRRHGGTGVSDEQRRAYEQRRAAVSSAARLGAMSE
jgi:hypothetical protein